MKNIDHEYTSNIVCPYCGEEWIDSWEFEADDGVIYCDECDKDFEYSRSVEVTYDTHKIKECRNENKLHSRFNKA